MELTREFRFEAAHRLPFVPLGHRCSRLHGHSFKLTVTIDGPVDPKTGWVMDFGEIKMHVSPLLGKLDHYYLNDVEGLENPTSEVIARWVWDRLKPHLPLLYCVEISETCQTSAKYYGEKE